MITSETDICNLALGHLGEAPITSLTEDTAAARACARHYESTRDELFRAHPWNFAKGRVTLSRIADAPAFGWTYQYQLPSDFMRAIEVNDEELGDLVSEEWLIEGDRILTDADAIQLVYMKRVEDVSKYDPLFVQAFALKLAIMLTETIRGTTGKTEQLTQAYERVVAPLARRVDANEGRRRKGTLPLNSGFVLARSNGV